MHLRAYIDESESHRHLDPHCYLLTASICPDSETDRTRAALLDLRLPRQQKLHWRQESARRKLTAVRRVGQLALSHLVVVREGTPHERSERRRRLCLARLLYELNRLGASEVVFESRGSADDRRDQSLVAALRSQGTIDPGLRSRHVKGPLEPLLWIPDLVCGAVSAKRIGDGTYLEQLQRASEIRIITL